MMREGVGLKEETGKEINESGSKCDVSGTLEIFKEFNEVYRQRLKKTDEACGDATQLKLKTLEDWVADLTEQNTVLVETVEALEKEALYRLELGINAEKCSRFDGFNVVDVCKVCKNKVHVNADGVCGKPKCHAACLSVSDNRGIYQRKINSQLQETEEKLRRAELETEKLKKNLSENESKLEKINKEIVASEKSAKEMRAALTAEVADKHDQVLALRRDVQHLEEKLRQADMQTHFKDDIIKELRKEIKIANSKVATQPKENKVVTILKEKLKDVKIVPDKCGGCSGVLKVILPQLNELKKRVNSGLCELHQKSNSNKNCNRLNMQIQYRMEELLTEIIDCLSVIINSVDAMGQAYDGACKTHHVPLDSRTESHFIPFISANSDTVEEIFVGKPCESSTTTSSVRNDMKQLLNEMQSQEQIIRYLKCALADTQNQLRYYTDNEQVLVNERASFRGGTTSYSLIPPYSSSDNYKSEISCDQLLEELQYLRERSQDDQKAMVQLEEQMKSLILAINTNQCFNSIQTEGAGCCGNQFLEINMQGEREGMIQCLKDQLNNIEECLLLGFNNLITDDSSGISPLKNERLCNWKKDLINEIKKACELLSEIDSFSLSHNKEREGFLNSYCMFEQRIKTLQDQIFQSQKAKEKIYDRLCALEKTQREYVASQSASLQKNGCNLGDSFAASVPVTDEVANLLNIIRCKDDVINNKENTIQRLMKEYQLGEQDNIPCYENSTRCDMKKATAEIIEKTLNEFLTFKRILVEKETQFDQLGSDLASLHRTFCTFVKEFPSSKLSKANNLLTQLENDLVYIVKKTKEYVLMCKENEFLVMRAKTRIGSLLAEFGACIQKGSSDQAKKVQQKVAGSDERKPAVTESRLKIAALENQVTCLNKKVEELTCALKEKEKYECHCEDSSLEEDSPEVSKTVLNFSSSKKQVTSCEVNIESKSCECEESGELSVEQQKHLPEELEISPPKLNVESQVEKEGLQKIRQVGQSLETKSSESCESEESSEEQKICFSKEQVVCSHKLDGGHEMEEAQKTDQSIVQSLESKFLDEHKDTMKKLNEDLKELNLQLQSRDKMITYQEETISVLQNSLKIEQEEYACLKSKFENIVKEKEEISKTRQSTAQFFEAKIADLEHQLKECHENAVSNICGPSSAFNNATVDNKSNSKISSGAMGWAPWSSKQAPVRRHIHDV